MKVTEELDSKENIMKKLITLVVGCALSGVAFAATTASFEELDVNQDGIVSRAEIDAASAEVQSSLQFDLADADKDGQLTRSEFLAAANGAGESSGRTGGTGTDGSSDSSGSSTSGGSDTGGSGSDSQ
jgi:Ca2+-binding EF-hand superfamily protein